MFTKAQRRAYTDAVNAPGVQTDLRVNVLDLDHKHLGSIGGRLLDGQVLLSRRSDVNFSANLTLVDIDTDLADLDLRHLISVQHGVLTEDYGWLWLPAIVGRIAATSDDGDLAELTLHDKSSFGLLPGAPERTWEEGMPVGRAIHDMFEDIGETRFSIPRSLRTGGPKLARDVDSGGPDENNAPTRVARRMARGRLHFFFDQRGRCTVRRPMGKPVLTWTEAEGTSRIRWDRDLTTIRNYVIARGRKGVRARVSAPPRHLFSPQTLVRGGKPTRLVHYFTDESIARERELERAAERELNRMLRERSEAQFACPPTFLAGPFDLVRAERSDGRFGEFWLSEASLPLGEGDMTVGYQQVRGRRRRGRVRLS